MAALSSDKVRVIWVEGNGPRWGLFRIGPMNTADTWDSSVYFAGSVEVATFISGASTAIGTVTSSTAAVLTLTLGGSTQATVFLSARGQSSTGYLV